MNCKNNISKYDNLEIRCSKLGHKLNFYYCRTEDNGQPCKNILNCWFESIPVKDFILSNYDNNLIDNLSAPPKPKITTIIELINKAKNNIKSSS